MIVQVNSDNHTDLDGTQIERIEELVRGRLARFTDWLTRAEVHISDPDGVRSRGSDARCVLEVRPEGRDPLTASAEADRPEAAVDAAAKAMLSVIERERGRLTDRKGH